MWRVTAEKKARSLLGKCSPAAAGALRLGGVVLVVVVFFLSLESLMGIAMHRMYDYAFAPDPILEWKMRPGFAGVYPPIGTKPISINSMGYRGVECARKKAPGTVRVFIVGDSFSFGLKVRNDETYAHFLPAEAAKLDPSVRLEVINGAVPGYCSLQALWRLRREAWKLSPDIVLVGFLVNDTMKSFAAEKDIIPSNPVLITARSILYRSRTFIALKKLSIQMRRDAGPGKVQGELHFDRVAPDDYRRNLEDMAGEIRLHRARGLFLNVPNVETTRTQQEYRLIFLDVARARGIPALDLYSSWHRDFPYARLDKLFLVDPGGGNRHPTPEGHKMIAEALARFLIAHKGYYLP
jgi:lysophospholipase L1-like esterase